MRQVPRCARGPLVRALNGLAPPDSNSWRRCLPALPDQETMSSRGPCSLRTGGALAGEPMTLTRVARFAPGLAALMSYRRGDLGYDLAAGLSVAAVAVPVGVA